jgi:hypothetical protein
MRKALIALIVCGAMVSAMAAVQVNLCTNPSATQYRSNARHTGDYRPVAGVPSNGKVTWSFRTGSTPSYLRPIQASKSSVDRYEVFTISGYLYNPEVPLPGKTVCLEWRQNCLIKPPWERHKCAVTDALGHYTFPLSMGTEGNWQFRTSFDGDGQYAASVSEPVNVHVNLWSSG